MSSARGGRCLAVKKARTPARPTQCKVCVSAALPFPNSKELRELVDSWYSRGLELTEVFRRVKMVCDTWPAQPWARSA
jgi:hypothetical protein